MQRFLTSAGPLFLAFLVPATGCSESIDATGVSVTAPSRAVVSESGDSNTIDVVLTAAPTADVRIPVFIPDVVAAEANLDRSELVFTPQNWDQTQTITVTGLPDETDNAPGDPDPFSVNFGSLESLDQAYDGRELKPITFRNLDDQVAWELIDVRTGEAPLGLSIAEGGDPAMFQIRLLDEPFSDVSIAFQLYNSADGQETLLPTNLSFVPAATDADEVHAITLNFTTDNYDQFQPFEVHALTDGNDEDPGKVFNLAAGSSGDLAYQTFFTEKAKGELPMSIYNLDPDSAEVVQTPAVVRVCEGQSATISLQLSSPPGESIDVSFEGEQFGAVFPGTTTLDDMVERTLTISVPDGAVNKDETFTATMRVVTTDERYLLNYAIPGENTREFTVTIVDGDIGQPPNMEEQQEGSLPLVLAQCGR